MLSKVLSRRNSGDVQALVFPMLAGFDAGTGRTAVKEESRGPSSSVLSKPEDSKGPGRRTRKCSLLWNGSTPL
jgi:hypothetical protein